MDPNLKAIKVLDLLKKYYSLPYKLIAKANVPTACQKKICMCATHFLLFVTKKTPNQKYDQYNFDLSKLGFHSNLEA